MSVQRARAGAGSAASARAHFAAACLARKRRAAVLFSAAE